MYPIFLSDFEKNFEFPHYILDKPTMPNFTKICPVVADLIFADGRTDGHTEANKRLLPTYVKSA
jgi:hypothetical protein